MHTDDTDLLSDRDDAREATAEERGTRYEASLSDADWLDIATDGLIEAVWPKGGQPTGSEWHDAQLRAALLQRQTRLQALRRAISAGRDAEAGKIVREAVTAYMVAVAQEGIR